MTVSQPEDDAARRELRAAVAALDAAEAAREPAQLSQALAQVARCHRAVGALAEADWYAKRGLAVARALSAVDASVDALCALAELALERAERLDTQDEARGAHRLRDTARDRAFEAAGLAQRAADPQWEVTVLLRVSDLFDRLGDHEDAIALQCRALGLITGATAGLRADAGSLHTTG
ncbi:MAG TPA: hypothetical protein VM845_05550 [Burkholderiaceae bacterium]|jgi:hypothetical protein|nr:hypothetical protein [Burkholderiaceae bacterium]